MAVYIADTCDQEILGGGGGDGTVTSISGLDPIVVTPDPLTNTGTIGLALITDATLSGDGSTSNPLSVVGGVDNNVIAIKLATTVVLPNTPTYSNGTGGVGATLTASTNGGLGNIDAIATVVADRILVKDQASALQNGIYSITQIGSVSTPYILTRTTDSDQTSELNEQIVSPSKGTVNKGRLFSQQTENPIVGTNSIVYTVVNGLFVTQAATGTQAIGQISWWNAAARQLSRGSGQFVWDETNSRLGIGTNVPSAPVHIVKNSIGVTTTDGMILSNTTSATNVLNQFSPRIRLIGQGWKTASTAGSQQVEWMMELQAQTGTNNPTSNLFFYRQANLGGLVEQMKFIQGPGGDRADFFIGSITTDKTITIGNGNGLNCSGQVTSNNFSANAAKSGLLTNIIATTATTLSRYLFASATSINYNLLLGGTDSKTPQVGESAASFISGEVNITKNGSGTHELFANTVFKPIAVTNNTSSLTNTATVYIEGASSASVTGANLALWVDAGTTRFDGDVKLNDAGNGIYIKEGTNATMGTATLVAGTVTVSTTKVTASSRIFLTIQSLGTVTVPSTIGITTRTAGTSFTITSTSAVDTSVIAWVIFEPA